MYRALLSLACLTSLVGAEYFIAPTGNDSNAGTNEAAPLKTVDKGMQKAVPGDTITLLDGTYPVIWDVTSGTAANWITLRAKNRRAATISLAATSGYSTEWNCIYMTNVAYIKIIGLTVIGANPGHDIVGSGHGINMAGSHHIVIQDCRVRDCSGSGISGSPEWWNNGTLVNGPCDFLTIEDNEVSGCAFWNMYQCHGISIWKANSAGLGADPSGFNCVIRRNISYANENKIGPWGSDVANATDGNGIILDCNNDNNYPYATLVEGNLVFNNGGRGIHALRSDNVTVRYNTCWHNNRNDLDGTWLQGELNNDGSVNFVAENNIAVGNTTAWSSALSVHTFGGTLSGVQLKNNIIFGTREVDFAFSETGTLTSNPLLVNPSTNPAVADFRLQAGSPAIDSANATPAPALDLAGTTRPQGAAYDRGAYERVAAVTNTAPVASNQSVTTTTNTAVAITLAATDANGDTLTYAIVASPAHGTLSGSGANRTYTPATSYTGADSFTFRANDGTVNSNTATVSITVSAPANTAPVASNQSVTTTTNTAVAITLAATDANGDTLTYAIVASPAHGTLSGSGANRTYTPATSYTGADSFTFRANDGTVNSNTATVSITVSAPANTAPVASNQSVTTTTNTAVAITLAATDANGDTLTYAIVASPAHGTLSGSGANRTYTPATSYTGADSFTFRANDGTVNSNTATVSITVSAPANTAPVISAATATPSPVTGTTTSLSATATDDAGEASLIYTWSATGPASVAFSPNGTNAAKVSTATFTLAGSYVLTVTATDAGSLSDSRTVAITVNGTSGTTPTGGTGNGGSSGCGSGVAVALLVGLGGMCGLRKRRR